MNKKSTEPWDVAVIGAGPAGAMTALLAARSGMRTLLVDKCEFPRSKVCGSCLNHIALSALEEVGLVGTVESLGAVDLQSLEVSVNGFKSSVSLSCGKALSRKALDAALVKEAVNSGVSFFSGTMARIVSDIDQRHSALQHRTLELRTKDSLWEERASFVVAADGIAGHVLDSEDVFTRRQAENARIGTGLTVARKDVPDFYSAGHIFMACSQGGYVGVVQLEDGDYDVACAFDRDFMKKHGDAGKAAASILAHAKMPHISFEHQSWRGTPPLTQSVSPKSAERIFVIGDAAGYTEPFTGEGIGWALSSALRLAPLLRDGLKVESEQLENIYQRWELTYRELLGSRHSISRQIASMLRWRYLPEAVSLAVAHSKTLESALVASALGPQLVSARHSHFQA